MCVFLLSIFVTSRAGATRILGVCRYDCIQQPHAQVPRGGLLQRWPIPHYRLQCGKCQYSLQCGTE